MLRLMSSFAAPVGAIVTGAVLAVILAFGGTAALNPSVASSQQMQQKPLVPYDQR